MSWEYRYFTSKEFACRCGCGLGESLDDLDMELLARLSTVREQFGPMSVASGVRCMMHNQNEGGKPGSAHIAIPGQRVCRAVDIRCTDSISRGKLLALVYPHFSRVGLHKSFIHMDVAGGPEYASPATWFY
jgi:uncharacterized protein YcbK (DUF882 family)